MTKPSRLFLLGAVVLVVGCATEPEFEQHQTRVPMLPTSARVLVNQDGVKFYEYQGVIYRERIDGNGWDVVPAWEQTTVTKTRTRGDGKAVIRD